MIKFILIGYVLNVLMLFYAEGIKDAKGVGLILFGLIGTIPYCFFCVCAYFIFLDYFNKNKTKRG